MLGFRKSRVLCVALIIAVVSMIISPAFCFTASAAIINPVSPQSEWNKVVDGWYTSSDGGFKFNIGSWKYSGRYGITLVEKSTGITNGCTIAVYDADEESIFENKTVSDFESVLSENAKVFEKTTVGNSEFTMYYCQTSTYDNFVFQANGFKYFINFIHGTGARADLTAFAVTVMESIVIADDDGNSGGDDGGDVTEDVFEYEIYEETVTITGYNGTGGDITIPSEIEGYPVTNIARGAFEGNATVTSVDMPSVTVVMSNAFASCGSLKSVNMPNIQTLGNDVFYSCGVLTSFDVGEDNPKYSTQDGVLFNKAKTELVLYPSGRTGAYVVPDSVTSIYYRAFAGCSSLSAITMPNVTVIINQAFQACTSLMTVTMPKIETICKGAFDSCGSITSFNVSDENLFYSVQDGILFNKSKTELVIYPAGKSGAYVVPESVTTLADRAFYRCYRLTSVSMPNVITVGDEAFGGCNNMTRVDMPKATTIGYGGFSKCTLLATINMPNVVVIGQNSFEGCGNLESVELPNIINVGNSAFYACNGLENISIPNATTLEFAAFDSCTALTQINMPNVTNIGRWAFNNCTSLTSVNMPNVTDIGGLAFGYCVSLKSLEAPKVVSIDNRAFAVSGLQNLYVSKVTSIDSTAFEGCENLTIHAPLNSYAHQFAENNGINFSQLLLKLIKSVSHEIVDGKIVFTVVTSAEGCNRIKVTLADDLGGYIAYTSSHTVNSEGNYVWLITTDAPTSTTKYAFDARSSESGTYIKEYFYYDVEMRAVPDHTDKNNWDKVVDDVFTSDKGGLQLYVPGWKTYTLSTSLSIVPSKYNGSGFTNAAVIAVYEPDSASDFALRTEEYFENVLSEDIKTFEKTTVCGYPAYYMVVPNEMYVWVINTPDYKFFINFMQAVSPYGSAIEEEAKQIMSSAVIYVAEEPADIKSVDYKISDNMVVFTVTTTPDFNRVKVTTADALSSYIAYTNNYEVNADGDYVFTISVPVINGETVYAFDARLIETGKYSKDYHYTTVNAEIVVENPAILDVTHKNSDGKVIFTVVTGAGEFNRIKVTTADNLKGSLGVASVHTINADGNYVWTIKIDEPSENTKYAFDLRDSSTNKYIKEYFYCDVEASTPSIIGISHVVANGKIVFTVTTKAGTYNRLKLTTADNLRGSLITSNTYTIDANGNYVWTIRFNAPTETTNFAFDLRDAETGKYLKDYGYYECVTDKTIKSVACSDAGDSIVFTVITKAGNYNRLRCGVSESLVGNIATSNIYTVNDDGDYVWTIKVTKPSESQALYFDLRNSDTNKFIKEYYVYNYNA